MRSPILATLLPAACAVTLLLATSVPLAAQQAELRGQVRDSLTGQPVVGAAVRLPDLQRYTLTNDAGWFLLRDVPAGTHRVLVVQLGYADYGAQLTAGTAVPVTLRLVPQPIQLEQIVVYNRSLDDRAHAQAHIWNTFWRSYDRDQIVMSGTTSALDLLKRMARLSIIPCIKGHDAAGLCLSRPHYTGEFYAPSIRSTGLTMRGYDIPFRVGAVARVAGSNLEGQQMLADASMPLRTHSIAASVMLDDRPFSLNRLHELRVTDLHRVETFGMRGERQIRLYSAAYIHRLATGVPRPGLELPDLEEFDPVLRPERRDRLFGWIRR
ncbi:MAG TPA: carboxypeptidase-like regulatory domain-containing protein [Longimicrobiales bacterium]|nr:carboxypeptidase-like regulatory domain-containing protein [Longimicrobiales bacterium]